MVVRSRDSNDALPEAAVFLLERDGLGSLGVNLCLALDDAELVEETARIACLLFQILSVPTPKQPITPIESPDIRSE